MKPSIILFPLFLLGCGDAALRPADGSSPDRDGALQADLAVTDLAPADLDTSAFCAGTALAGTCAPPFLAPLEACFEPTGPCTVDGSMQSGQYTVCWPNGSRLVVNAATANIQVDASRSGTACYRVTSGSGAGLTLRPTGSASTLGYDNDTGTLTCPDGSTRAVGSAYAGCAAFKDLIDGPDFSACTMGICP